MRIQFALAAMVAVGFVGCGKKGPNLTQVQGALTWHGKPFPGVMVRFVPDAEGGPPRPSSSGVTDEKGHYDLVCDEPHKPGAIAGKHSVVVIDPEALKRRLPVVKKDPDALKGPALVEDLEALKKGIEKVYPPKYMTPWRTPLQAVVGAGGPQVIDLNVE